MWYIAYFDNKFDLVKSDVDLTKKGYEKIEDDGNTDNSYDVELKINPNVLKGVMTVRNYYDFNDDGIIYIKESKIVEIRSDEDEQSKSK